MDQQVSPAVVVIVLILIVAILVGLYFLVVERKPADQGDEVIEEGIPPEAEMMPDDEGDGGDAVDGEATEESDTEEDADETSGTPETPEGGVDETSDDQPQDEPDE